MNMITSADLPAMFLVIAKAMQENEEYLCRLDAEMGDGDLGLTMRKGFTAMPDIIEELLKTESNLGKLLVKAGMKMAGIVPSTMGTLMGSGIMSGGKALFDVGDMDGDALALFYTGFADGIKKRGKCAPGDRTILDALATAAEYASACPTRELPAVAAAALEGAQAGLEATKTMQPRFGKAAVFAAKAEGRVDQGAVVGEIFVRSIYEYCTKQNIMGR